MKNIANKQTQYLLMLEPLFKYTILFNTNQPEPTIQSTCTYGLDTKAVLL